MSIDVSVEASMKASFFDIFSAGVGISTKTGFNWGTAGSEVRHIH